MMDSPSLCIADTNVLIDLHNGGVLDEILQAIEGPVEA